jgi:hypothetical protein
MSLGDIKNYTISYSGLELQVDAIDNGDGTTQIVIKCITGYADINALYWNDGVADNDDFSLGTKKDNSLNMNGTGENWDGGVKLSSTGLGTAGTSKDTYLTAGETLNAFTINYSWDTLDTIGVRATSTSNPEGSIKGVGGDPDVTEAPDISVDDVCVTEGETATLRSICRRPMTTTLRSHTTPWVEPPLKDLTTRALPAQSRLLRARLPLQSTWSPPTTARWSRKRTTRSYWTARR